MNPGCNLHTAFVLSLTASPDEFTMVPEGPLVLGNVLTRTGPAYWTLPAEYCVLRTTY
jgi:hypothetical protein